MPSLDLPADLVAFLAAGKQLEYDPEPCEAGAITLLSLSELKLERFPVETGSLPEYEQDPHYPDVKSYLVLGVNLVASCTGGYEPVGLLLWLPVERRYGVWDSSHCGIQVFGPAVIWGQIVDAPDSHITLGGRALTRTPRRWNRWCRGRRTHTTINRCTSRSRPSKVPANGAVSPPPGRGIGSSDSRRHSRGAARRVPALRCIHIHLAIVYVNGCEPGEYLTSNVSRCIQRSPDERGIYGTIQTNRGGVVDPGPRSDEQSVRAPIRW